MAKKAYAKTLKEGMPKKLIIDYTQPKFKDPKKVWSLGVLDTKDLSEEVKERLRALQPGDEVCVHSRKNEAGFNELVDVTDKADAEFKPAKGGGGGWKKGGNVGAGNKFDGDGAQVGNALTNAAALLPAGSSAEQLEAMAWDVIQAGERLKKRLVNLREGKEEKPPEPKAKPEAMLDYLPFEDDDVSF